MKRLVLLIAATMVTACSQPEPPEFSVGWLLTQPYGPACNAGQRANDNPTSEFFAHPVTDRCTFDCLAVGGEETCEAVGGFCDRLDLCRWWAVRWP
ncbi:MAG TPA: hypothetical protein VFZ61_28015 [Polyangiales bacterium]